MPRTETTPRAQLDGFLAKFDPAVAKIAKAALAAMRKRLPGAVEMVYDNYNALAIGFGTGEKMADLVFSIAVYPRWVSLFFAHGVALPDPDRRLRGSGSRIRHVVLERGAQTLDEPDVKELMMAALAHADWMPKAGARGRIVIRSVSAKQRPRRPR